MINFQNWLENRILQENYQPEFGGILKVKPNPTQLIEIQNRVLSAYPDLKPLPQDKLHVTMLHQKLAKPLAAATIPPLNTELSFNPSEVYLVERDGRKSVFAVVNEQKPIKDYMMNLSQMLSVAMEPNRVYHVTVANLTGNVADSVGHTEESPIMNGANNISV